MPESRDPALRKLVMAADKDPDLLARLCKEPETIAEKYGVSLAEAEIAQLKRVGDLRRLVAEFTEARIPDPIFYPIDRWWAEEIGKHVLLYNPVMYPIRYPIWDWIFYPVPFERFRKVLNPGLLRRRPG
jgi:hypothetical protein